MRNSCGRALASILFLLTISPAQAELKPEVKAFVDEAVKEHALFEEDVVHLLEQAQFKQEIIDKITGRAEKKSWSQYRPIFLNEQRITKGIAFWDKNEALLQGAEEKYGVAAEIIVAILGVETYYGERAGNTRVIDALYTLAFSYPERAPFFREEFKQFLLLAKEAGFDPLAVTGSYAGAMGAPQFISSSYRNYAVDADGDSHPDLWKSHPDIIASVAHYFAEHGWKSGEPVALLAEDVDPQRHKSLFFSDGDRPLKEVVDVEDRPTHAISELTEAGIHPNTPVDGGSLAYLMPFETTPGQFEYWVGLHNFYVITRYNRSPLYAMAVFQLGREIAARRQQRGERPVAAP